MTKLVRLYLSGTQQPIFINPVHVTAMRQVGDDVQIWTTDNSDPLTIEDDIYAVAARLGLKLHDTLKEN